MSDREANGIDDAKVGCRFSHESCSSDRDETDPESVVEIEQDSDGSAESEHPMGNSDALFGGRAAYF